MKKPLVLPNLTQPALGNLHGWGVDNIRWQWVQAVHDSESKLFLAYTCALLLLFQRLFSTDCCWHCKGHVYTYMSQSCLPSSCDTSYLVNPYSSAFRCSHVLWDQELILLYVFGDPRDQCSLSTVSFWKRDIQTTFPKLQVWAHKSSKQHFHAFPIKILVRSPNETKIKDSVCLVDLLFYMLWEFHLVVLEDAKVFFSFPLLLNPAIKSCPKSLPQTTLFHAVGLF